MGRKKIEIETIDNPKKRKSSFLKRRSGLLKKGYEISVLADTPAAIIAFAPDGQLCQFSRGGRLEDILINYLNGPDDPLIPIPNRAEMIAELERIKTENDNTAAEQEARNGGANPRINLADNGDDEDLKRLLTCNRDLLEFMKEIIRILNLHPQTASLSTLEYCQVKLHIILQQIAIRKNQQGDHHQQQQQQYNIPLQLQQQQYNPLQQQQMQQQYINPPQQQQQMQQQQQQYQYYQLQQQQPVTVENNVITPNYMQQFLNPGQEQQQPRTVHQNNMNVESSGAQGVTIPFLDQLRASASVPVQQSAASFYQNNSERGLIRGGSSSNASSRQHENKPLPLQQQYLSRQMGIPNGHVGQGLNQNPVRPHPGNSHVDRSSISFQQPTIQNFFGGLLGAVADNSNNDLDQQNKNQ